MDPNGTEADFGFTGSEAPGTQGYIKLVERTFKDIQGHQSTTEGVHGQTSAGIRLFGVAC